MISLQMPSPLMMPHIARHYRAIAEVACCTTHTACRSAEGMSIALCRALSIMIICWLGWLEDVWSDVSALKVAGLKPDSFDSAVDGQSAEGKPVA